MGESVPESLFVGRQKEIERVCDELRGRHNLVLTGRFGMGRTTLLRHLARERKDEWRFIFLNGSLTAAKICEALHLALFPGVLGPEPGKRLSWKTQRHQIGDRPNRGRRALVVVLDDIAKVTRQRLDFIRWLNDLDTFRIIAVTEPFLPEAGLISLRIALCPAPVILLEPLSPAKAKLFFEAWAEQQGMAWNDDQVHGLVLATHGYPLGMTEAVKSLGDGSGPAWPADPPALEGKVGRPG